MPTISGAMIAIALALLSISLLASIATAADKDAPQWVQDKICSDSEQDCAVGEASVQEGETSAIARAERFATDAWRKRGRGISRKHR